MNNNYDDIINLPHHVSNKHPQMSMRDRAAQFSPFAALVGLDDSIAETNRQVEQFVELDENYLQELDEKLQDILERIDEQPLVEVTYFVADGIKDGGQYVTLCDKIKRIDNETQSLIMLNGQKIFLKLIRQIVMV